MYDWQLAVPPVVDTGVELPVQRLEIFNSSSDQPAPAIGKTEVTEPALVLEVSLLLSTPVLAGQAGVLGGDRHQVVGVLSCVLLLSTQLHLHTETNNLVMWGVCVL